jgi:hypothetical protein
MSALVSRGGTVIRQAGNVLNQRVDSRLRLWVCEESTDLIGTTEPAGPLADEYGTRGDWLGERGDAREGINGRLASRTNLSRPRSRRTCPCSLMNIEHAPLTAIVKGDVESDDFRSPVSRADQGMLPSASRLVHKRLPRSPRVTRYHAHRTSCASGLPSRSPAVSSCLST